MGSAVSFFCFDWYAGHPAYIETRSLFLSLGLTPYHIAQLHKKFRFIDTDDSGSIQLIELLNYLDVERTNYTEKVFGMFDIDKSGSVDFPEFAVSLWNYCTLESNTLALFTFDLYDDDHSGVMQTNEVQVMLQDIYGSKFQHNKHARKIHHKLQQLEKFKCHRDAFTDFARKHPALLFPAFETQMRIVKKCLGEVFWMGVTERRHRMEHQNLLLPIDIIREKMQRRRCNVVHRQEVLVEVNKKKFKKGNKKAKTNKVQVERCGTDSSDESIVSNSSSASALHIEPPSGKHSFDVAHKPRGYVADDVVQRVPFRTHCSLKIKCDKICTMNNVTTRVDATHSKKNSPNSSGLPSPPIAVSPKGHNNVKYSFMPSPRVHCDIIMEEFRTTESVDILYDKASPKKSHHSIPFA